MSLVEDYFKNSSTMRVKKYGSDTLLLCQVGSFLEAYLVELADGRKLGKADVVSLR